MGARPFPGQDGRQLLPIGYPVDLVLMAKRRPLLDEIARYEGWSQSCSSACTPVAADAVIEGTRQEQRPAGHDPGSVQLVSHLA